MLETLHASGWWLRPIAHSNIGEIKQRDTPQSNFWIQRDALTSQNRTSESLTDFSGKGPTSKLSITPLFVGPPDVIEYGDGTCL